MQTKNEADTKAMMREYREWILGQAIEDADITEKEENIRIDAGFALGEVNFYDMEEMIVIELRITEKRDDETVFFLHFELRDLDYAKELFAEMVASLEELKTRKSVQVLLSCTSALTTGLMADKLNETAGLLSADFHFDAVPFPELYEKAPGYDMILLAPQIAYEEARIKSVLEDVPVVKIQPRLFATYDAAAILESVRQEFENRSKAGKKELEKKTVSVEQSDFRIFTITILLHSYGKIRVITRMYQNGQPVGEDTTYGPFKGEGKNHLLRAITDFLDAAKCLSGKYDAIGITLPGEIHDGKLQLIRWISPDINLKQMLEDRYHVPVVLKNNVQAGIVGFHSRHTHYDSAVMLSQGIGSRFGGTGILVNGKLWEGATNMAGEVRYLTKRFYGMTITSGVVSSPREMLDATDLVARAVISIVNPEILLVRSGMLLDIADLRDILLETIPERNLPKLRKITDNDALEYMMLGIMLLSIEELEKR